MATGSGLAANFDAANFRTKIKQVMKMGLPEDPALRPTFRWSPARTFTHADSSGNPWNFAATPTTVVAHPDVQVDCAVEFVPRVTLAGGTAMGHFDTPRVLITVLDVDFTTIDGANTVLLGGDVYNIDYTAPPTGLFGVTIFTLHVSAVDET